MELEKGIALFEQCLSDPNIRRRYDEGDAMRAGQTKHGFDEHAIPVVEESRRIADIIRSLHPDAIDDWAYHVIVPFGALLHDIGGCISIEEHDVTGAQMMQAYLSELTLKGDTETLPKDIQNRIVRIIACHRAGKFLKKSFADTALDVVFLADKSIGDEDRVRPGRARILRWLTRLGLASIPLRNNGSHDRINYAIETSKLVATDNGELVLRLTVKDAVLRDSFLAFWEPKRKSIYEVIYEHGYYKKNFHAMEVAAANLGFKFLLEFNGLRHAFNVQTKSWNPIC